MCEKGVGNKTPTAGLFCSGERPTQIIGHHAFWKIDSGIEQSAIATSRRSVAVQAPRQSLNGRDPSPRCRRWTIS
jgi:hypothetical protein